MNKTLIKDAMEIVDYALNKVMPEEAVENVLKNFKKSNGKIIMIAIGKAAYSMGKKASEIIDIDKGLIITKYNHSKGNIDGIEIIEAGHPIPDENSIIATKTAIRLVENLTEDDTVLFLVSGGGSSLFENPLIPLDKLQDISERLIKSGADINEINLIRKRLSKVKGGKFAEMCKPANVINIILSDIIGDPLENIASGPTVFDSSDKNKALDIIRKYQIDIDEEIYYMLDKDNITDLYNVKTFISGNNQILKDAAVLMARKLNYNTITIDKPLTGDIADAKNTLINTLNKHKNKNNIAIIASGEITVKVNGKGLGGRNQELSLRVGKELNDNDTVICAFGSDGTDGPTDFAGAIISNEDIHDELDDYLLNNDSYNYLLKYGQPIITGPTGTNVNDLYFILKKELK